MKKEKKKKHRELKGEFCKKCKHDHVPNSGPCYKLGCGCHAFYEASVAEREETVKEFMKKKYGKKSKEK